MIFSRAEGAGLEEKSRGQNQLVIVAVEAAGGDLHANTASYGETRVRVMRTQLVLRKDEAWSYKFLHLSIVCAAVVEGGVGSEFRPEIFAEMELPGRVP